MKINPIHNSTKNIKYLKQNNIGGFMYKTTLLGRSKGGKYRHGHTFLNFYFTDFDTCSVIYFVISCLFT